MASWKALLVCLSVDLPVPKYKGKGAVGEEDTGLNLLLLQLAQICPFWALSQYAVGQSPLQFVLEAEGGAPVPW